MLNKEKFAAELIEMIVESEQIAAIKGKLAFCSKIDCIKCDFYDTPNCDNARRDWANAEYIEKPIDPKLPLDTPVFVSMDKERWIKGHFAGFDETNHNAPYKIFSLGATSWTSSDTTSWKYIKME